MTTLAPTLNIPQAQFLAMPHKFKAYVAGFGSGKTWAGCAGQAKHFYEHPRINAGYFAPTYPQIRDIFYPTMEEVAHDWGMTAKVHQANHEVSLHQAGRYMGTILCRSMEDPGSIVGFKIGHAQVDEIDVMQKEKALNAWRKILARMRYKVDGLKNGVDVTTTPEGFRFVYDQFVKAGRETPSLAALYGLVQASTYDNEVYLPDDYIPSLLQSYPAQLIDAYINGQFVNLQTGTVYAAYHREKNRCHDTIQPGEPLFVGMDFNVGKMAAVVHVKRDGKPRAVAEVVNGYDTPAMIATLKGRFPGHQIRVYPDASGGSRKTVNASETDLALLRGAGFVVVAPPTNPPVKDRINAMNGMFCNANGERHYLVNDAMCPTYADCLEQQPWTAGGEPDKSTGHDHACFAGETLVETDQGVRRIDALPASGLIRGFNGEFVRYENAGRTGIARKVVKVDFSDGRSVVCTPEHKFLTMNGWVEAKDLLTTTCYDWILSKTGCQLWSKLLAERNRFSTDFLIGSVGSISSGSGSDYTGPCGSSTTVRSLPGLLYTTLMETGQIIKLTILRLCRWLITPPITWMTQGEENCQKKQSSVPARRPLSGMDQKRERIGISGNTNYTGQNSTSHLLGSVSNVGSTMKPWTLGTICSVLNRAKQHTERLPGSITRREIALIVGSLSRPTNISPSNTVPGNAEFKPRGVSVVRVSPAGEQDVFCLTVPGHGCFALHSGLVVSNCDAAGYFIHYDYPIIRRTATIRPLML